MLYREIISVCSEIYTKHINTLCGKNAEFVNVKPVCTYNDHWASKVSGSEQAFKRAFKPLRIKRSAV